MLHKVVKMGFMTTYYRNGIGNVIEIAGANDVPEGVRVMLANLWR